jgi:hypothetical protein
MEHIMKDIVGAIGASVADAIVENPLALLAIAATVVSYAIYQAGTSLAQATAPAVVNVRNAAVDLYDAARSEVESWFESPPVLALADNGFDIPPVPPGATVIPIRNAE